MNDFQQEFDIVGGMRDRDDGINAVLAGRDINADWTRRFTTHLGYLAWTGQEFTADHVVAVVGPPPTGSRNVIGALFAGDRGEYVAWVHGDRDPLVKARAALYAVWLEAQS